MDFLTYAYYSFEKFQWVEQFEQTYGKSPGTQDVDRWIAVITLSRFGNLRDQAESFSNEAARDYLREDIEAQKEAAVRSSILGEVKAAGARATLQGTLNERKFFASFFQKRSSSFLIVTQLQTPSAAPTIPHVAL